MITPGDIHDLVPLAYVDDLVGGVLLPNDGRPTRSTPRRRWPRVRAAGARRIVENVKVNSIVVEDGRAIGVAAPTSGDIRADAVVNCAGMWARELGDAAGAVVPLHAAEHFYIVTEPIDGLVADHARAARPGRVRLLQGRRRQAAGRVVRAGRQAVGHAADPRIVLLRFAACRLRAHRAARWPPQRIACRCSPTTGIRLFFNGPESFTPDDRYLLGESPDVRGLFVAAGFNSIGIQSAGGAGKVLADWIVDGRPPMDLWDVDVRRVMPFQTQPHLPARPHGRGARPALRDALALPPARDRARRAPLAGPRPARGSRRVLRRDRRLGARQLVRARRRDAGLRVQLRPAELVRLLGRGAPRGAHRRRRCSTSRRSPSSSSKGRDAEARPQPDLRQRHRRAGRQDRLHAMAQRATAASRPTSP